MTSTIYGSSIENKGNLNIGKNALISGNLDVCGNVDIYGNLTIHDVSINYTYITTTNVSISDNIISVGESSLSNTYDKGIIFNCIQDSSNQAFLYKHNEQSFVLANVSDISSINQSLTINNIEKYSNLKLNKLTTQNDVQINNGLYVNNDSSFNSNVNIKDLFIQQYLNSNNIINQ